MARRAVAIPAGLEPATRGVEIRYSIQLSYGTVLGRPDTIASAGRSYHCQYEKSASSASGRRTVFPQSATKGGGWSVFLPPTSISRRRDAALARRRSKMA